MAEKVTAHALLAAMKTHEASDLHLKAGMPPVFRVGGHLRNLTIPAMSGEEIEACLEAIIPPKRRSFYEEFGDLDFAAHLGEGERFRVNIFRAGGVTQSRTEVVAEQVVPATQRRRARNALTAARTVLDPP